MVDCLVALLQLRRSKASCKVSGSAKPTKPRLDLFSKKSWGVEEDSSAKLRAQGKVGLVESLEDLDGERAATGPDTRNVSHRLAWWIWQNITGVKAEDIMAVTGLSENTVRAIKKDRGFKSKVGDPTQAVDVLGKGKAQLVVGMAIEKLLGRLHTESEGMTTKELLSIISDLGDRIGFGRTTTHQHEVAVIGQDALKKVKSAHTNNSKKRFAHAEDIESIVERDSKAAATRRLNSSKPPRVEVRTGAGKEAQTDVSSKGG